VRFAQEIIDSGSSDHAILDPEMSGFILGRGASLSRDFGFASRARQGSGELITYSGDGHLITLAPTGTGKTSGPVICNALTHPGQLIVLDMKGEVSVATAQARRNIGQQVHVLDLHDDDAPPLFQELQEPKDSLNPLDLVIRSGTDIAAIARSFAAELIERGVDERERFWNDWAETMIAGGIAWLLADRPPEERRLSRLFDLWHHTDVVYQLAVLMDQKEVKNRAAYAAFSAFLQLPDKETRPSVLGVTQTHVRLFDSQLVRSLTDTTSFDLDAFISGAPTSLYIIVPPLRLTAYAPLLRMWLSGLILAMTQRKNPPKERTLMLVDEAGNIGKIDALLTAATLLRSFGFTLWTFWQNAAQLSIYGPQANTLVDNAGVVQVFGARNHRMAQDIANLIGGVSPDEILRMRPDEQILLVEGKTIRCRQVRHYNDKYFGAAKA
jgi:type IV secretion system protein VirD4